jgi:PAS domain S-box-containing protein
MANALAESQEMLRTIADYTYDWEYWLLPDGVLQWVSPSCKRITGYTASEFMADQELMHRIVHQEDLSLFKQHLEKIETGEEYSNDLDFRIIHRSGQIVWIDHHCILISRPDGTSLGRRVSNRDITGRKMMEKEKENLQAQLVQAQKMEAVGRLAGGVAHDFNNMLGVILGHAEMAIDKVDFSHPLHEDLLEIQKAAQRSADLTRQLLAFARKQTISPQVLNLNDTISGMLKMLRRLIGEDIDLVWKPGANLWPVMMDPSQIDQILANLAVNAKDAINEAGNLVIETQNTVFDETYSSTHPGFMSGEYVLLAVSDNGCGMDKKILDNLFEPFYTTKEVGKGTGLGLATIYGIVKQNNGFINVYSEPGDGTSFKIYLPRIQASETAKAPDIEKEPSCGAETVLLVEDEKAILRLGKMILERYGYTVLAAESPVEALAFTKEYDGPIDLLITDVVMPVINGKELKDKITAIRPEIKTLFMSGYTADVIAHHGVIEEDVFYLQKPFSVKTLAARVREVLEQKS